MKHEKLLFKLKKKKKNTDDMSSKKVIITSKIIRQVSECSNCAAEKSSKSLFKAKV